jgi:hypothetical protein
MSNDPNLNRTSPDARQPRARNKPKCVLVTLLIVAVYVLHQDSWNWTKSAPMLFGFLPPGLAYHAGYSVWCAVMMAILVKVAWPRHLEEQKDQLPK